MKEETGASTKFHTYRVLIWCKVNAVIPKVHCATATCKVLNFHQNLHDSITLHTCNSSYSATEMINFGFYNLLLESILETISFSTVFILLFIFKNSIMRSIKYCDYQWSLYLQQSCNFSPKDKFSHVSVPTMTLNCLCP